MGYARKILAVKAERDVTPITEALIEGIPWEDSYTVRYLDGVYVDVSANEATGEITIAVCAVRGSKILTVTTLAESCRSTQAAELEAIQVAQMLFVGEPVYSDCRRACEQTGAVWITRGRNRLADSAASVRKNFRARQ